MMVLVPLMLVLLSTLASVGQGFVVIRNAHTSSTSLRAMKRPSSSSSSVSLLNSLPARTPCKIVVIGVGGAGGNAVTRMLQANTSLLPNNNSHNNDIEFWAVNTDHQALGKAAAAGANILTIGGTGLGAGGDPETGRLAAEASASEICNRIFLRNDDTVDLCFITAGMGGGTGIGAAPVVARLAALSHTNCLTVAIVTTPFGFEGRHRQRQASQALRTLREYADTVIPVSNDKLLNGIIPSSTPLDQAFLVADDILRQGIAGIANVIVRPGLINVDFADVKSILQKKWPTSDDDDKGNDNSWQNKNAWIGIGVGTGDDAATEAAEAAIASPLLAQPMDAADSVVFCITGGSTMTLNQVNAASQRIYQAVSPTANVIFGAVIDEDMGDDISITVLATGSGGETGAVLETPAPSFSRTSATTPRLSRRPLTTTTTKKAPSFLKNRKP